VSSDFDSDYPRRLDARSSVRSRANEHDLKDVMSAYAPPDEGGGSALSRTQVMTVGAALAVSLVLAGAFAGLSGTSQQKTAAVEAPVAAAPGSTAPAKPMPAECAGQTWPYVSRECLAARGDPPPPATAAKKGN
jgi:hypothetical protein